MSTSDPIINAIPMAMATMMPIGWLGGVSKSVTSSVDTAIRKSVNSQLTSVFTQLVYLKSN